MCKNHLPASCQLHEGDFRPPSNCLAEETSTRPLMEEEIGLEGLGERLSRGQPFGKSH